MRILLSLIGGILSFICSAQTVNFEWVKQMGGPLNDGGKDIAIDASGNIYTTGYFTGTADFDPGPAVFSLTAPLSSEEDIFITKFDANGNFIWAKQFSGNFLDVSYSMKVDNQGNIYLTGIFFSTCDFDPGPGVYNLVSAGNEDVFVAKLNGSGNLMWAKRMGAARFDRSNSISLDNAGNVYITGYFLLTVDFDPGVAVLNLTSDGGEDMFIVKLNNNGNLVWVKQMSGLLFEGGYSIAVSATGNVYTSGIFLGTSDFDPSSSVYELISTGLSDAFVCKLDAEGNFKWAKRMGGNGYIRSLGMSLDAAENVYTTGFFDKAVDFDPGLLEFNLTSNGDDDLFISRLDSNGNHGWTKQIGGTSYDAGYSITLDVSSNIYVTGFFQDVVDFDAGAGMTNLSSSGFSDIFILKLNPAGNFIWAKKMGGPSFDRPNSIKVDNLNNIYTIGYFEQMVDFDPGQSQFNLTTTGGNDIFLHKMSQCLAVSTFQLSASTCKSYTLNNQVYHESGIYTQVLSNAAGCDSIITLNLTITRVINFKDVTICQGQQYFAAGSYQTISGVYADTLLNVLGCDSVIVTQLTVNPSPQPNLGADKNLCGDEILILDPGIFTSYLWHNGNNTRTVTATAPGLFWVRVTNEKNCSATDSFTINRINQRPSLFLPANQQICAGAALNIQVSGYNRYLWSTGENTSSIIIRNPGIYELQVTDADNCTGSDSIVVTQKTDCLPLAIPNTFTPNNDGRNDIFKPIINLEIVDYNMVIFNRWGQKIFESNNISVGWDGNIATATPQQGVYVYLIRYKNYQGKWNQFKGTITLLQ
jgi:gliding motility-associated-like protein